MAASSANQKTENGQGLEGLQILWGPQSERGLAICRIWGSISKQGPIISSVFEFALEHSGTWAHSFSSPFVLHQLSFRRLHRI